MSARAIPDVVLNRQREASDPGVSAWVSANAGSGKTHVLSSRVIRLLLAGIDPSKILCLTFTKAAAANMANRVFERLAAWATLDDTALDKEIRAIGGVSASPRVRASARKLFAAALETPGGLKVQTIHAFCTRLLQQFPFEARVPARFAVLDDAQQNRLIDEIQMSVLLEAAGNPTGDLGRALETVIALTSDHQFKRALSEAIRQRDRIAAWLEGVGGPAGAALDLARALGFDPADTIAAIEAEFFSASLFLQSEWPALINAFTCAGKTGADYTNCLEAARVTSGRQRVEEYLSLFCTKEMRPIKNFPVGALKKEHPALAEKLAKEQNRVCALLDRLRAVEIRDRTVALFTLSNAMTGRYRAEKNRRGLLDYDDLIARTLSLLTDTSAQWVHYKLDFGIDHLLIDEAQDTSPTQWEIVELLTSEFAAGLGAREGVTRSIFAVGDDKQSIFSFQGAEPRQFHAKQAEFRRVFEGSGLPWRDVRLDYSFRSGDSVLGSVQDVFAPKDIYGSVTTDEAGISPHLSLPGAAPGVVDLWPIVEPDKKAAIEPWDAPFDTTSEMSPRVRLARQIAESAKRWIGRDRIGSGAARRLVRAGDILVLVRQRGEIFEAVIRALKDAGVEVAGADRLVLTEHIAVMDLLALADALLLRDDDLALAAVLKSPLFGLTEEQLFNLAVDRKGNLRVALEAHHSTVARKLDALEIAARKQSPFAFYSALLGADRARQQLLARLGPEANDALDEFLNLAFDYERRETPSLQGFVNWLRTASAEIKRDMEIARDEVRVMTVHGAKGLEAPIVIIADTTTEPEGPPALRQRLLQVPAQSSAPDAPTPWAWMPTKKDEIARTAAARVLADTAESDEYRRLLYVAMTRAAERLIVCGAVGERKMPTGCWYQLVETGLTATGEFIEAPADHGSGTVRRYMKAKDGADDALELPLAPAVQRIAAPPWLDKQTQDEKVRAPITPSSDEMPVKRKTAASVEARENALLRGNLVHRLMQSLPGVKRDREQAARDYLTKEGKALTEAQRDGILRQVLVVLDSSAFAPLFGPGSRAEVPIVGRVGSHDVSGQIDRLAVTETDVFIADYKTNRPAPRIISDVPRAYVRQLALYRALLRQIYPGRTVRAALLWTDVPDLMELSATVLDAEIDALTLS